MQKNHSIGIYVILLLSMFFWGTSYVFTKIVLSYADPITIIFTRLVISVVLLWVVIAIFYHKSGIQKSDIKYLLLLAFCEPFVYFLGETYGIERVSPVVASLVISTIPVFTAIVLTIFFRTKLNRLNQIGILVSFVGIVLMILGKNMQLQVDMVGLLFLLIAVAASIGYGLILTKLSAQVHPIWLIAFQNTVGLILFLPLWLTCGQPIVYTHEAISLLGFSLTPVQAFWTCIVILSVFSSTLAFMFYSIAVSKIGLARSIVFTNLIAIFTAITAYFLVDELFNMQKIMAIIIVLIGVVLTQMGKKYA